MIDFTKPVIDADGNPVRILCTDAEGTFPVVGLVGAGCIYSWTADGKAWPNDDAPALSNIPEEPTVVYHTVSLPLDDKAWTGLRLGRWYCSTLCEAEALCATAITEWDGVVKISSIDGKLTNLEFIPAK